EIGISCEDFNKGIARSPGLQRIFGPLRVEGGTVQRQVFVAHFNELTGDLLRDGSFRQGSDEAVALPKHHVLNLDGVKMEFVLVGKGKFSMGSPAEENNRTRDM